MPLRECATIRSTPQRFCLGQIIGGGELDRGEVEQLLTQAARGLVDDDGKS